MNILILEPHGDDAILSANSLLALPEANIDIITFADFRTSEGLKEFFPSIRKTEYIDHNNLYYFDRKPILKTNQVHRDYIEGKPIIDNYNNMLLDYFGDLYTKAENLAYDTIKSIDFDQYDLLACPVGLSHPYHVVLRNALIRSINEDCLDKPVLWFADKPYISNRYNKEIWSLMPRFLGVDSEINPGYEEIPELTDIYKIMKKVYPTEMNLFTYTGDIILKFHCKYLYDSKYENLIGLIKSYL